MSTKLIKSSIIFSLMTFISRIFGFIRDMVAAHLFGASSGYDAFILAFKIPNLMRRLFAEGAFSQAFVPILSEYKAGRDQKTIQNLINHVTGNLALVLLVVTILGMLLAPWVIRVFAPGFEAEGERLQLAAFMLKITFPYIFLISLTALAGGILNTYGRFAGPAFTPVLLNLSMIGTSIFLAPQMAQPEVALAWGVFIAGGLQLIFQIPFLLKIGLLPKPRINWQDPGVRRILFLMGPAILGASVSQINLLVDTMFASFLPVGSISWLYYSDRLMEFPLGVFGVALSTVVLPSLSTEFVKGSQQNFIGTLDWGLRWVLLIGVPSMLGLFLLAGPLLVTLFYSGRFTEQDVWMSRQSLMAYALAVVGIMMTKVLASAFYARQDIKTPVKVSIFILFVNVGLNTLFIIPLGHAGLALATSIASTINAICLLGILLKRGAYSFSKGWGLFLLRLLLANGVLVCVVLYCAPELRIWLGWTRTYQAMQLLPIIGLGALAYGLSLWLTGLKPKHLITNSAG